MEIRFMFTKENYKDNKIELDTELLHLISYKLQNVAQLLLHV